MSDSRVQYYAGIPRRGHCRSARTGHRTRAPKIAVGTSFAAPERQLRARRGRMSPAPNGPPSDGLKMPEAAQNGISAPLAGCGKVAAEAVAGVDRRAGGADGCFFEPEFGVLRVLNGDLAAVGQAGWVSRVVMRMRL